MSDWFWEQMGHTIKNAIHHFLHCINNKVSFIQLEEISSHMNLGLWIFKTFLSLANLTINYSFSSFWSAKQQLWFFPLNGHLVYHKTATFCFEATVHFFQEIIISNQSMSWLAAFSFLICIHYASEKTILLAAGIRMQFLRYGKLL